MDANDDYRVLQRAREVWEDSVNWERFTVQYGRRLCYAQLGAHLYSYKVGDYACAVLAVLAQESERTLNGED